MEHLCIYVLSFSAMFYSVQSISLVPPWLSLFLSILLKILIMVKYKIKLTILTILIVQFSSVKYVKIVVQPTSIIHNSFHLAKLKF